MADVPSFAHGPGQVADEGTYETNLAEINNLLQYSIASNDIQITPATELYNYRANVEKLLTYGNCAADSHLKMLFGPTIKRYILM